MKRQIGDIYYEYAHLDCHPETCSCASNYRIIEFPYTIAWANTIKDAEKVVELLQESQNA